MVAYGSMVYIISILLVVKSTHNNIDHTVANMTPFCVCVLQSQGGVQNMMHKLFFFIILWCVSLYCAPKTKPTKTCAERLSNVAERVRYLVELKVWSDSVRYLVQLKVWSDSVRYLVQLKVRSAPRNARAPLNAILRLRPSIARAEKPDFSIRFWRANLCIHNE